MNKITLLLLLFAVQITKAESKTSLLQQLSQVNAEWKNQTDVSGVAITTNPKTYNDCIVAHLMLVEKTLRARDVSQLSPSQKQNRLALLNELNGYWKAGTFPVNDYLTYKNPVFIDRKGTHCAVGYLMMKSGSDDLAQRINAKEKFAYVHEIKTKGVKEWADKNGFAVNELAWIQPGYPPTTPTYDLDGGMNGTVHTISPDSSGQVVYVGGSFTQSVSGVTCNHVAAWTSGFAGWDWLPVGSGLNGTVHTLILRNNKLYAGGEFTMAGSTTVNHVAVYDVTLGQWQSLGSLDSTVRALTFFNGELYAGGDFTGFVSKWNGSQWINVTSGFIYGEGVRTLEAWNNLLVIGGNFECATGALREHVATYNGSQMGTLGFGTTTPVNDFAVHEGNLFAACDVISGADTCAIAVYENFDWEVKLKIVSDNMMTYFQGNSIKSLLSVNNQLLAAGDFYCGSGMTYGSNLMELSKTPSGWGDTTQLLCYPIIATDTSIKTLAALGYNLYFGGEFVSNLGDTTNHIAYLELTPTGIRPVSSPSFTVSVFPNPALSSIYIQTNTSDAILQTEILDATGRKAVGETGTAASNNVPVESLSSGIYILRVQTKNGWSSARFVKE